MAMDEPNNEIPPSPPPGGYIPSGGFPPPGTYSTAPSEINLWAIVSLVAGVLGWLGVFGLGGIAAVITGHIAKNQIRSSNGAQSGNGLATAGLVLGYVNIAFTLVGLCLLALVILGVLSAPFVCMPFTNGIQIQP